MSLPRLSYNSHDEMPCDSRECKPPKPRIPPPFPPPPSSSPGSHGRTTFVTALIIAGSALAFLILCLSLFLFFRRRRQRRRRDALLEAVLAPAAPAATPDGGGGGPDLEEAEQGEVVHHAWHIRTVGLDEAAIESIALTRYRAGAGGASDCAVCLGEFSDGELLRLLPLCAHAFHVPCIDTWLRSHVNCPLCRSHVLDPAPTSAAPAAEQSDSPAGTDADAGQAVSSMGTTEQGQLDQQASEQRELRLQIDRHDGQSNSPEQPHRHPGRNFRRVVSMDSPSPIASAEEAAPDDEQAGGEKRGTGGAVHCELSPGCSGRLKNHRGMKRSLSVGSRWALISRHCRRSSSLLPL